MMQMCNCAVKYIMCIMPIVHISAVSYFAFCMYCIAFLSREKTFANCLKIDFRVYRKL